MITVTDRAGVILATHSGELFDRVITPTIGPEIVLDTGLEFWFDATTPANWTNNLEGTSTVNQEGTIVHGGAYAARVDVDSSNSLGQIQYANTRVVVGDWIAVDGWAKVSAVGSSIPTMRYTIGGAESVSHRLTTTYAHYYSTIRAELNNGAAIAKRYGSCASLSVYFDDLSFHVIDLVSTFGEHRYQTTSADVMVTACLKPQSGTCIGFWANVDDPDNPLNGVACYTDGSIVHMVKVLAGVYTELITFTQAWNDYEEMVLIKHGTTYSLYQGGVLVDAAQTIADAGIINNLNHVQFSTSSESKFCSFLVI